MQKVDTLHTSKTMMEIEKCNLQANWGRFTETTEFRCSLQCSSAQQDFPILQVDRKGSSVLTTRFSVIFLAIAGRLRV
jgi:hypothetical protein